MKNVPYKKVFENGILQNPITKENPYLVSEKTRGGKKLRKSNNSKSYGLIVEKIGVLSFAKRIVKYQLVKSDKTRNGIRKTNELIVHHA